MRIAIYCQHVLGIGHFFRAMEIARALEGHEVLFVEGGEPLEGFTPPHHVRRLFLPPITMDADFKAMETRDGDLETVKARRKSLLIEALGDFDPEVLVTELFPFGRRRFRFELLPALDFLKARRPSPSVVCSLRDILVEKAQAAHFQAWVLETLNRYYHMLLVHADPRVVTLEETFGPVDAIAIPVYYTGFVTRQSPTAVSIGKGEGDAPGVSGGGPASRSRRPNRFPGLQRDRIIVVSSGGGKVGTDLMAAAVRAVQILPDRDLRLRAFAGPFMDEADRHTLSGLASRDPRTHLVPFSDDFQAELRSADLSISMAGYNTCMDILASGVRALVLPFPQNREQSIRAAKLSDLGLLRVIDSLEPTCLAHAIQKALSDDWPSGPEVPIDLSGASTSARWIESFNRRACSESSGSHPPDASSIGVQERPPPRE